MTLRGRFFSVCLWLASATSGGAWASSGEMAVQWSYSISADPLTTEKAWALDPGELNPHRQRWLLSRKIELNELKPREIPDAKPEFRYGVEVMGLNATATAYVRGDGPWYRPMGEFPCQAEPLATFSTLEGSRKAAETAATAWEAAVQSQSKQLVALFKAVRGASPGMALVKAQLLFDEWLKSVETAWRVAAYEAARNAEWKHHLAEAKRLKACDKPGPSIQSTARAAEDEDGDKGKDGDEYVPPSRRKPLPWELMMEPPATGADGRAGLPVDEMKLEARAPAKLWDGMYSVRLNLTVAGRKLNGTFLIDSGSGTSVISPEFLANQGILAAWVATPAFRRVPWGGTLAPVVSVDLAALGNTPLPIRDFALYDTEFFSQPEYPSGCCDGVLGNDFLRHYVVELQPGPPAEIKLWPRANFHLASSGAERESVPAQWLETALTPAGEVVSTCMTVPESKSSLKLVGVRWDTGREDALNIHLPWQKEARRALGGGSNAWQLRCGPTASERVAREVPATFPTVDGPESEALKAKVPAVSIGMELLGRGRVFFDLPHGRIWFPDQTSSEPIRRDRSGLSTRYTFVRTGKLEKRALVVDAIGKGSPAEALFKRGLRPGMQITQIDKIDADDLDVRQVSRRLAGAYGPEVYVQWKSPQGLKLGVMRVRKSEPGDPVAK